MEPLSCENILAELAFYVFRTNEEKLREEKISFNRPAMCPDFAGSEALISDSREANSFPSGSNPYSCNAHTA